MDISAEANYYHVDKHVQLRVYTFNPDTESSLPILFFPGWVTLIEVFIPIIKEFNNNGHRVYYVDMRDKKSSIIDNLTLDQFSIDKMVYDIKQLVHLLGLNDKQFYMFGSSFGSNLVIKYLSDFDDLLPDAAISVVPALKLKFNLWQKILIRLPLFLQKLSIFIVESYIKRRFANPDEPELVYRFSSKLYDVDLRKVKLSALAIDKRGGFDMSCIDPDSIETRLLIVGAKNDMMHEAGETEEFARKFPTAKFIDILSNKFTHSGHMGRLGSLFYKGLNYDDLIPKSVDSPVFESKIILNDIPEILKNDNN